MIHYTCISVHSDYDWCSLDRKFQGRWRYCTGYGKYGMAGPSCVPRTQAAFKAADYRVLGCQKSEARS